VQSCETQTVAVWSRRGVEGTLADGWGSLDAEPCITSHSFLQPLMILAQHYHPRL